MTDRPSNIVFGEPEQLDIPLSTREKQLILSKFLGLPENLNGLVILELFSGAVQTSFKPEVLARSSDSVASNYVGVDLHENTGIGHISANVYDVVKDFPTGSFDYVIMNHPPIWFTIARAKEWRRANSNRLATPTLADAEGFTKFVGECTRIVKPRKGNRISVAHGFTDQDINALWRYGSNFIPHYNEWTITKIPLGKESPFTLVDENGQYRETLYFPEHAFQLVHT